MNIGIDVTSALNQQAGIARYTKNLVLNLLKEDKDNFYKLYSFFGKDKNNLFNHSRADLKTLNYPPQIFKTYLFLLRLIKKTPDYLTKEADIIHSTDFVLPASRKKPSIVTVHDLAFLHFSKFYTFKNRTYMKSVAKFSVENADAVLAISKNTKNDLINLLNIEEEKIFVTYNGLDNSFSPCSHQNCVEIRKKYKLPQNYILSIGTIQPRKNISRLIQAFKILKEDKNIDHKLVLIGEQGWHCKQSINELENNKDIIYIKHLDENDLPAIYSNANVFVYPSLYEGFGLPPLEAMACGTPVVTSNNSSLPEVVGNAALKINPKETEEIAQSIKQIIEDEKLAKELNTKGLKQAKKFSWSKTAQETLDVYKIIAN